ncbi:hypothetical protein ASC75_12575 [Aminobacter sp. DSM 101952]|uniref:ATP-binding protein n=1 Tax=Aminobacter sp. DSM 101952 TaxID=2735891 RepID=UPI0006F6B1B7|nr:ATP-binding protein [Aminobacter sp. DSM 101952]KQU64844.1 hypothetical protein ASC75_12575 [Aminobacter sp. DSM 101952]
MTTLDDYLTGQFHVDRQEVISLEETILKTCQTLVSVFDGTNGWPYRIVRGIAPSYSDTISHSTTAMVALSLFKAAGSWNPGQLAGVAQSGSYFDESQDGKVTRDKSLKTAKLAAELLRKATLDGKGKASTASGTYGSNDPITSAFLSALIEGTTGLAGDWEPHKKLIQHHAKIRSGLPPLDEFANMFDFSALKNGEANDPVPNALIPLRVVQTVRDAGLPSPPDLTPFRRYFETTLHDQLSFSSIPDSRFDPAELAFCLEGLLLTQANVVDRPLLERTLEVLESAQKHSAFWRPTKPFLATARGMTLFPVSVEVANSILRSCELFDGSALRNTVGSANVGLFRRYWQWLNARKVTFQATSDGATGYVGWDSEHVNQIDVIHVWETSQVLEFLLAYHRLLKAHIARTTLTLSKFTFRAPPTKRPSWEAIEEQYEPAKMLGQPYQVYNRIGEDFVKGWLDKVSPKSYSMLLYGPPGTGKTTAAEKLAEALGFPLITITVADFLVGGGGQVEARAKAIFEVLDSQSNSVVLFDEIDAFLLDRDTERYSAQDTVFQFMTPGMLTKINDLRKAERLIFVIATNYENRIDPAIKRTGRIDRKYLLLPYDKGGRSRTIRSLAGEQSANSVSDEIAESSLFLGYGDLRNAVPSKITQENAVQVAQNMKSMGRTTRIASFTNRLPTGRDFKSGEEKGKWPLEEFICLLALALEGPDAAHHNGFVDKSACENFIRAGKYFGLTNISEMVEMAAPDIKLEVRAAVASYLESI